MTGVKISWLPTIITNEMFLIYACCKSNVMFSHYRKHLQTIHSTAQQIYLLMLTLNVSLLCIRTSLITLLLLQNFRKILYHLHNCAKNMPVSDIITFITLLHV